MKSLKITIIALFSLVLLNAVTFVNSTERDPNNKEIKQADVLASLSIDKNKAQVPTNG